MHLVNKQDNVTLCLHLIDQPFNTAFKLTAELCPRNKSREVKQMNLFFREFGRHIPVRDFQSEPFGNGRLPNARLTDKAGVVLSPTAQDMNGPVNLIFSADNAVNLILTRFGGQVRAVQGQKLSARLGFLFLFAASPERWEPFSL